VKQLDKSFFQDSNFNNFCEIQNSTLSDNDFYQYHDLLSKLFIDKVFLSCIKPTRYEFHIAESFEEFDF
jgi:hypothetical protein